MVTVSLAVTLNVPAAALSMVTVQVATSPLTVGPLTVGVRPPLTVTPRAPKLGVPVPAREGRRRDRERLRGADDVHGRQRRDADQGIDVVLDRRGAVAAVAAAEAVAGGAGDGHAAHGHRVAGLDVEGSGRIAVDGLRPGSARSRLPLGP